MKSDVANSTYVQRLLAIGLPTQPTKAKRAVKPAKSSVSADDAALLAALRAETAAQPTGDLLSVPAVRARTTLSKERFDAAALRLQASDVAFLTYTDCTWHLSESERAALVLDEQGVYYNGIALRRGR